MTDCLDDPDKVRVHQKTKRTMIVNYVLQLIVKEYEFRELRKNSNVMKGLVMFIIYVPNDMFCQRHTIGKNPWKLEIEWSVVVHIFTKPITLGLSNKNIDRASFRSVSPISELPLSMIPKVHKIERKKYRLHQPYTTTKYEPFWQSVKKPASMTKTWFIHMIGSQAIKLFFWSFR